MRDKRDTRSGDKRIPRDRMIAARAAETFGVVDLTDLEAIGVDRHAAWRRERRGTLHRLHVGVYSIVPPRLLRPEGRWLAAVLAAGDLAALCLQHGAALWDLRSPPAPPVHVIVPSCSGRRRRSGLIVHRSRNLTREEVAVRKGIRVTTPARTLRDLKPRVPDSNFRAMLKRAHGQGLDLGEFGLIDEAEASELERRFLALCRRHSLPRPQTQVIIGPYTVDFCWPKHGLIVETDGFATHGNRVSFEDDRERDAWLEACDWKVVHFTWRQLRDEPAKVVARLRALLALAAGGMARR